jgi:hypothetical protein
MSDSVPSVERTWELLERAYADDGIEVLGWTGNEVMLLPPAAPSWSELMCTVTKTPSGSHEDLVLIVALRVPHPDEMSFDEVVSG